MNRFDPMTSTHDDHPPKRAWTKAQLGAWVVIAVVAASVKSVVVYAPTLADAFAEGQTVRFGEPAITAPAPRTPETPFAGEEPSDEGMIRVDFESPAGTLTGQRVIMRSVERAAEWICLIA